MAKQTRVSKYKKLRSEIDNMDTYSLEQIETEAKNKKIESVRNSVRHASKKNDSDMKQATLTMSIEELLEGHSEYVGFKETQREEKTSLRKKQLFKLLYIGLLIVFIAVITIIVWVMIDSRR